MKFQICAYFRDLLNESKRAAFSVFTETHFNTGGLGEFSKSMQTLSYVSSLHISLGFCQPSSCLDKAM